MSLHQFSKLNKRKSKRIGRGFGSGKGKTGGKGTKGQNARGKLSVTHSHYEGGQRPLFKRLPYKRGKGNKSVSPKPVVISTKNLEKLPENTVVDIDLLLKLNLINSYQARKKGVKILGASSLPKGLKINLPTSRKIAQRISKTQKAEK